MAAEIGEYVVGAYLKLIEECDVVDYNVRPAGGGMSGLGEFDVIGLRFRDATAVLCEVATHLQGLEYGGGYDDSVDRVQKKLIRQQQHAENTLQLFPTRRYMLWSPRVPKGRLLTALEAIEGLELVVNQGYTAAVEKLRLQARSTAANIGNPFFRSLQILERLRT